MSGMPVTLFYLLSACGAVTAVLVVLVVYGNTLSTREDEGLYLNNAEQTMMASVQQKLTARMDRLARVIVTLAVISGALLAISAIVWVWIGLKS